LRQKQSDKSFNTENYFKYDIYIYHKTIEDYTTTVPPIDYILLGILLLLRLKMNVVLVNCTQIKE